MRMTDTMPSDLKLGNVDLIAIVAMVTIIEEALKDSEEES